MQGRRRWRSGRGWACEILVSGWLIICLYRPYRRQAGSHRYSALPKGCVDPVGAGLPAIGPVQALQIL
ncbi:hypothetical protein GEV38_24000 [Pseudomonas sp. 13159349]|nr:hypothetical protein GEV38_24000 [Pseudomonas sp. 13159349]TXI07395.1 MAG: hypothetical protein E6Q70_05335 [Pseudomonas monteilii]